MKEAAAWALGYIARHNGDLAQEVVDKGAIRRWCCACRSRSCR